MGTLLFNSLQVNGNLVKTVMENGRRYFVAPMTLINPGVLAGSQGPLMYTDEHTSKAANSWNKIPLVVYHPTDPTGKHVSVNHPGVLAKSGIGEVRKASFNGKLRAEGWFDADRTRAVDKRVYDALVNGQQIELSTGLFTDNRPAPFGSHHNGRPYSHTAENHVPDHLAILPDQVGACSNKDGCGVLVNQSIKESGWQLVENAFCATGEGNGQDNSCSSTGGKGAGASGEKAVSLERGQKISFKFHEESDTPSNGTVIEIHKGKDTVRVKTKDRKEHVIKLSQIITSNWLEVNSNPEGCNQYKDCGGGSAKSGKDIGKQVSEHFGHLLSGGQVDQKASIHRVNAEDKIVEVQPVEGRDAHTTGSRVEATMKAADEFEKANEGWNVVVRDPKAVHNAWQSVENCGGEGSGIPGPCPSSGSIADIHASADKMDPKEAKQKAEQLTSGMGKEQLSSSLKSMGFTVKGSESAKSMREKIVQQVTELAATGETTRSVDSIFKGTNNMSKMSNWQPLVDNSKESEFRECTDECDDTECFDECMDEVYNSWTELKQQSVDNAGINQPRCPEVGQYLRTGAGTGKGDAHRAAKAGHGTLFSRSKGSEGMDEDYGSPASLLDNMEKRYARNDTSMPKGTGDCGCGGGKTCNCDEWKPIEASLTKQHS